MVNQIITDEYSTVLSKTTSIDLVLCIGPKELQSTILKQSNIETIVSGYLHSEIYIDSLEHIRTLENIMSNKKNITLYAKESLGIRNPDVIQVTDEDEAISVINNTGSRYSTSIFTTSSDIASKFLKEIKSKQVLVNTSPSIENFLDITQKDLYNEKTIIYPTSNKTDDSRVEINI
jgi:gamma-glutamyl phosphate reductase